MAVTPNSAVYPQTPRLIGQGISTLIAPLTQSTFFAGAVGGTKVAGLWVTSGDGGSAHGFGIYTQSSGLITANITVLLPVTIGVPVNLLSTAVWPGLPIDADGNPYIMLASTAETLVAVYSSSLGSGTQLVLGGVAADLATTPNQIVTPQIPRLIGAGISTSTPAATPITIFSGGVNGTKVMGLFATSQDTVDRTLTFELVHGAFGFAFFGFATIPALSGYGGPPPLNLLSPTIWPGLPLDSDGNPYFLLTGTSDTYQILFNALSSGLRFFVCGVAADF